MTRAELELLRPVSASMGIMLETLAERLARAGWSALGLARQVARSASRDDPAGGRARDPVHERDPDRDRRDARRSGSRRCSRCATLARRARPPRRGDRAELPRQARDADGRPSRTRRSRSSCGRSRRRGSCSARRRTCRRRRTSPTTSSRSFSTPGSTTGAASHRSRSTTSIPRHRGRRSPGSREATASRGLTLVPRLPLYPEHVQSSIAGSTRPSRRPSCARSDALGLAREDRWAPGEPVDVPFIVRRDALPLELDRQGARRRRARAAPRRRAVTSASASSRPPIGSAAKSAATRSRTS